MEQCDFRIFQHSRLATINCKSNKVYNEIRQAHYKKVLVVCGGFYFNLIRAFTAENCFFLQMHFRSTKLHSLLLFNHYYKVDFSFWHRMKNLGHLSSQYIWDVRVGREVDGVYYIEGPILRLLKKMRESQRLFSFCS